MDYQKAKEIALNYNAKINACKEYENAYYFYNKINSETTGGIDDFVVLKESGRILSLSTYILTYTPTSFPKQIEF